MEASQPTGDAEECSSSESGWTMYLTSPMHDNGDSDDLDDVEVDDDDDDDEDEDDDDGDGDGGGGGGSSKNNSSDGKDEGDEDDDSMASDASTGRAHNKYSYKKGDGGIKALKHPKQDEANDGNYNQYSSHLCRISPKLEKNRDGKLRNPFQREAASASSQSNPKARKPNLSNK